MRPLDFLYHVLNFVAPAAFVAVALSLVGRWFVRQPIGWRWWQLAAIHFVVGVAVLAGGLLLFGRDGKMATYAALVLAGATSQWLASRAWRR